MGRYVTRTGVVVNVSDEKAEALGSQLAPFVEEESGQPRSSRKSSRKTAQSSKS